MAKHTFTHARSVQNEKGNITATIDISGQVEGMIRGGFIYHNSKFTLPQNGTFIVNTDTTSSKYESARNHYYAVVGGNSDVNDNLKNIAGVNRANLYAGHSTGSASISPASFSLDHDYTTGVVSYSASYNTQQVLSDDGGFQNISIVRKPSIPITQEFVIPGRNSGPIIQFLGMYTPPTISINVEGVRQNPICDVSDPCSYTPWIPAALNIFEANGYVITSKSFNTNAIDGSFSASYEATFIS